MKRTDLVALSIVLAVLLGLPAGLFGYQAWRTQAAGVLVIDIIARTPESGGFAPDRLQLQAGQSVRLRISSPDAVHGFTIPGLGVNVDEIYPGKVVEVDLTPEQPGRYAFACTRWCGVDHWRMRGVIEVVGAEGSVLPAEEPPLFQRLGVDLDAALHPAHVVPAIRPSAGRGAGLKVTLPVELGDPARRITLPPAEAFQLLRSDPANAALSDDDVWDLVAWAWLKDAKPEALARAKTLFARDCAACHGPEGKGDGPAGAELPGMQKMDPAMPQGPENFTDAGMMLAASDLLLQGKLLRGGMGTGMPEFGSLYSDGEQWAMIAYLRTFLFQK
jgi:mono/diheme cytochrome c family protein